MIIVSVIIPYYKKKDYIKSTIKSVLNQTFKSFEIIIVYDDEDRNDLVYLKKIQSLDKRIKIILNSKNIGAGLSRNKAIRLAKGKYIAFLDSDDLWNKKKINTQLDFMKKNQCNISHTSYSIIDKRGNISGTRKAKNLTYNDLLTSCDIGLSTVMIKKKILDKYSFVNLKTKEDYVLWLKLAQKRHQFFGINKKLTYWRNLDDSLSSSTIQKLFDGYKVYRKYLNQSIIQSFISLLVLSKNYLIK
mgnify:CR=1 FL=1|tara:strand:- start:1402 stop:2136 length:735 start_codon:yes stop_codon:yes gene_type:complete